MAGKRQHYQPQFLLKGFSSKRSGKSYFSWLYRKNATPKEVNIRHISVQKRFYENGNPKIDDAITREENDLGILINKLRNSSNTNNLKSKDAASLIAHLEIRTRHLREGMHAFSKNFFIESINYLKITDNFNKFISMSIEKKIREDLLSKSIPKNKRREYRLYMKRKARPDIENKFNALLNHAHDEFPKHLPEIVKKGQLSALSKSVIPIKRADEYIKLNWKLSFSEEPYILGDFGVLFKIDSPKNYTTFWTKDFKLLNVFLPISTNLLLIGSTSLDVGKTNTLELNKAIASHSRDYFISSCNNRRISSLIDLIGTKSEFFTEKEIFEFCKNLFKL
ncbi:MAG: DUF4238 domain-containing protein [Candidatus Lokiarchaeota archaeon]|nr:DUF4238 domain-containing protein [Candidatus Lokiarchaeota archaeon]